MQIIQVTRKKKYLPLLLLGDEQESMIDKYITGSDMFVLEEDGVIGEIVVCKISEGIFEIKNLAILPQYQNRGYGRKLLDFVCEKYKYAAKIQVGTGESTVPFYEKCGFKKSHVIKNFFLANYDHPIFENGKQLIDMIYLEKN